MVSNCIMVQNLKIQNGSIHRLLLCYHMSWKSSMVIEMSPLIKAKAFATHPGILTNSGEFSLLVYYEVMIYVTNVDRIDLVFD